MKRIAQLNSLEWLVYALFALITWPILFREGMFMDAIQYSAVAKNLAEGYGTFWFPQLSYCNIGGLKAFHEHPPLVFGIESLFFRVLGPGMFTERFYTALVGMLTIFLIAKIWKIVVEEEWKKYSFLPMLCWLLIIEVPWSFENNMQENTMGIFVLLSVYTYLKLKNWKGELLMAFCLLCAFLSKGIPGLFPIAFPFLWAMIKEGSGLYNAFWKSVKVFLFLLLLSGFLLLLPGAALSLKTYLLERVLHRITQDPVVSSRFYILWKCVEDMSVLIIALIVFYLLKLKQKRVFTWSVKDFLMWFLFAFCGVAPMMLTLVQRGFYMVPAFPFFAIAFSFLLLPLIENMKLVRLQSIKLRGVLFGIIICGAFVLTYLSYGKVWREKKQMLLVREFEAKIPEGEIVGADAVLWDNWTFQTALMRYAAVSIVKNDANRKYYIDAPGGMPLDDSWQLIYSSKTGVKILKKRY